MRIKKDRLVWAEFKNSSSLIAGFLYAVIQFGIYSATFTFIPLLGRKFMLPDGQFNSMLVFYFIVSMGTNMILKKILNAGNKRIFGILSFLSLSIGIVIMGYSSNYIQLLLAQFMIGISHGIGMPLFLGIAMSDSRSENRAISVGIFQSVYALGMFSGPPASTRLAEIFGFERMSILIGLFICGIAFITFLSFKNQLFPSK
jgi:predicted MFS family arabinose efflux permease